LYVDGDSLSNFSAYSFGTGIVIGITSEAAKPTACGRSSLKVSLYGSLGSTSTPGISLYAPGFFGAPVMKLK
jgi:hypothetical protein